eukprot:gene7462-11786_t
MNKEIPGFYFDEKTKRYFKIDPRSKHYQEYLAEKNKKKLKEKQEKSFKNVEYYNQFNRIREFEMFKNPKIQKKYELFIQRCNKKNIKQNNGEGITGKSIMKSYFKDLSKQQFIATQNDRLHSYEKMNDEFHSNASLFFMGSVITKSHWNHKGESCMISQIGDDSYSHIFECKMQSARSIYSIFRKTIYTFEISNDCQNLAIGGSKSAYFYNIETKKQILMFTKSEDVLSQQIFNEHLVLNGQRNGEIKMYDIRSRKMTNFKLKTKYPVISMNVLNDDIHLVSSSMNGNLFLFDIRFAKTPLIKYENHSNKSSYLNFTMDKNEDFIFAPGDDQLVRVYNVNTKDVNHTIGPFEESISDIIFDDDYIIFGSNNNIFYHGEK